MDIGADIHTVWTEFNPVLDTACLLILRRGIPHLANGIKLPPACSSYGEGPGSVMRLIFQFLPKCEKFQGFLAKELFHGYAAVGVRVL